MSARALVDPSILKLAEKHALEFLSTIAERHVGPTATRQELMKVLSVPLSDGGEEPAAVIDALASVPEGLVGSVSPRYFGFVIGGSLPVTIAADWLTSVWDQNAGLFTTSPLNSVAEDVVRGWLLDLFGLPEGAGVGLVTGCQMANFTCLAAARHAVLRHAGWNVEEEGLLGAPAVDLVIGGEAHITIETSMRMLGFGTRRLRRTEVDGQGRMKPDSLRKLVASSSGPLIICAQSGNVNTGAIDPLQEIAEIAKDKGAWLHVDGAFGLWASASPSRRSLNAGIELADSWATDAHKWLNVPYDSGIAIVRESAAQRAALTAAAAYLEQTAGEERDPFEWTPEFSRRARGFTVYAALRTLGRRGIAALVDGGCDRARQIAGLLARDPRVEILNEVTLNQVLVRFHPPAGNADEFTREMVARVQREGTCWLAGTTWQGKAAMRISVSNWATSEEDVERSAAAILRCIDG
jgi:glutamate/tyrosine decarboxylase-like PLP-dependent enzyme